MNETKVDCSKADDETKNVSEIRKDFIKRLFAVAVSVGFASTLINMHWVKGTTFPSPEEWEHLFILLTGLVATIGSWDGYFQALEKAPLEKFGRFLIDIFLVFLYLILLVTSKNQYLWVFLLSAIYLLYWFWDILSVIEHDEKFILDGEKHPTWTKFKILQHVYINGLKHKAGVNKGSAITFIWTVFFIAEAILFLNTNDQNIIGLAAINIGALVLYRVAKANRDSLTHDDEYIPYVPGLALLTLFMVVSMV
ncbi:hypothetical protein RYZ26_17230 [Terasakiella sp. A23]|uniref:hypothetical protein n=1 Tax=Terasakiella sp. FCG-A23 TaxID=3080561 RepID=UPI0029534BFA|nr:hypothetical protein [Terasakiella sp. A23]MDV7341355.1 hypothetical protein [Terasakiella sp. A23]